MLYETWWAMVLGFTIAGLIEVMVDRERIADLIGGTDLQSVSMATLFGAASSSCSFGAVASTKALFKKGASAVAAFGAFQVASTNLVFEVGLMMWALLGWEFVVANFTAAFFLIAISAGLLFMLPGRWFDRARSQLQAPTDPHCGDSVERKNAVTDERSDETLYFCSTDCREAYQDDPGRAQTAHTGKAMTRVAEQTIREWRMLFVDIVVGFVVAGIVGAAVPRSYWAVLFGFEGVVGVVLSALIGVGIGIVTFVCSGGDVPFAVILWQRGMPFGGVMAFLFSDLVTPPTVDAYRRYYGWFIAFVLFGVLSISAVLSGIIMHYVWGGLGLIPAAGQLGGRLPYTYIHYLNGVFTILFAAQLILGRSALQGEHDH